jgi:hypothetical protein
MRQAVLASMKGRGEHAGKEYDAGSWLVKMFGNPQLGRRK